MTPVKIVEISTATMGLLNAVRSAWKLPELSNSCTELPIMTMPYIRMAKPTRMRPRS